jgi:hypothetical protein
VSGANGFNGSTFTYSERRIGERTGWSRAELKKLRGGLDEDVHWKRLQGAVSFNLAGLKQLWKKTRAAELLDLQALAEPAAPKPTILLAPLNAPRTMRVIALPLNPRIVLAEDELRQRYTVRVTDNGVFHVGLEIEAEPDPANPGIWRVVGPVPRWAGDRAYKAPAGRSAALLQKGMH